MKFGFSRYGVFHLVVLICWTIYIYSIDDWLDGDRSFPFYNLPLIAISLMLSPYVTIATIIGLIIINIRKLVNNNSFLLEKFESVGELLIFVPIFFVPLNSTFPNFYIGSLPVIFIIDQIHKLGHKETVNFKLTIVITTIISILIIIQAFIISDDVLLLVLVLSIIILGVIPVLKPIFNKSSWFWFQLWQAYSVPLIIYYLLFETWGHKFFMFE
jgi:hypothetical protein